MKFALFFLLCLLPITSIYAQKVDTPPSLGIELTSFSPFFYKLENGSTVIVGEVENKQEFPVTGVKIWAGFYNDVNLQPIETAIGTTLLEVIPPHEKSPYIIKSASTTDAITNISVNLLGFNSAPPKQEFLEIVPDSLEIDDSIISGIINNHAGSISENTRIHIILYDSFIPPRVIGASSTILGNIDSNSSIKFSFEEKRLTTATSLKIIAESDNFVSNSISKQILSSEIILKKIIIQDISITDSEGNKLSSAKVNSKIYFESTISAQSLEDDFVDQPYIYYVQILESKQINGQNKSFVEFIGSYESNFDEPGFQKPIVEWTPTKPGLYFVETYVWNPNGIALGSPGPVLLVLVN